MTLSPISRRRQAPGTVEFADRGFANEKGLQVRATFQVGEQVHWRARFRVLPRAVRVDLLTIQRSASGWERVISGHELWLSHPDVPGYTGWVGPGAYEGAGRYILRFVRGGTILAEGEFEVLPGGDDRIH
jgi:hypothetical protein